MTDLQKLINKGESDTLEFKENFNKEVVLTAGSFANTKGGTILIGVADGGDIVGTQISRETSRRWVNNITQSTEPMLIPEIDAREINGKKVAIIGIKEFPIKPVAVRGRCYRRVGTSNRLMAPQEIAEMHLDSRGTSWDKSPARHASLDDLDLGIINKYIKRANDTGRRKIEDSEDPIQVLEKLDLLTEGRPSWAAVLLFSKKPQRFLSQAVIHCGRFKKDTIVIDDRMVQGPVMDQIDEAIDFIRKNINVEFVMTGRPQREQVWDYPLNALREALINAVCHRDYAIPSNVEIRIYDDRLVVWSPGGLPLGITLDDLLKPHSSKLRNKGIGGVFYDVGLIEQWGSGIDKMVSLSQAAGLPEPTFEEYQGFQVTFRKDIYTEEYLKNIGLNERQVEAVMYAKERGRITNKEYREISGVTDRTALRDLNTICEVGVFRRIGVTGRKTEYILTRHKPDKGDNIPT